MKEWLFYFIIDYDQFWKDIRENKRPLVNKHKNRTFAPSKIKV